jgi:hypothetical protein
LAGTKFKLTTAAVFKVAAHAKVGLTTAAFFAVAVAGGRSIMM